DGVVCFVSNNSFVDQIAFDGMRKHLAEDFSLIYHVDLHGNVRQNPKLSGTTHNVFRIQVGVGITVAVRSKNHAESHLLYHRVPEFWTKEEKYSWLAESSQVKGVASWTHLAPTSQHHWLLAEGAEEYAAFAPLGSVETKGAKGTEAASIFKTYSVGLQTNRDDWVYGFDRDNLIEKVSLLLETYNSEIDRWKRAKRPKDIDNFVIVDDTK